MNDRNSIPSPATSLASSASHRYGLCMTDTPPKGDRIAKVLARAGLASRRGAEAIIT
ncbi:MAG: pseudouridine synthase, partial [Pseudomonadota bacterium]